MSPKKKTNQLLIIRLLVDESVSYLDSLICVPICFRQWQKIWSKKGSYETKKRFNSHSSLKNVSLWLSLSLSLSPPWMATQGMAQPSAKKRSFLLRDLFKLCRSISRVLPRDKTKHHHKAKHDTKETKRLDEEHKRNTPNAFEFRVSFTK